MYPRRTRTVRQVLGMGLVVTVVVLALSACGGGGAKDRAEEAATMKTVAGDGGPATEAGFCGTSDVVLDAEGNLYISDAELYCSGPGGNTVRKVDKEGTITTVAGTGWPSFSGDGGPATKAELYAPIAVTLDREGNLDISDGENYRIRKVDKEGIISTIAGTGEAGYSGDGGPATEAALKDPWGIAVDGEGNVFVADHHNSVVRKIDNNGTITTVAGTGKPGFNREKGPATKVMLNEPVGLFLDWDSGVLYIADKFNARIRALRLEGS